MRTISRQLYKFLLKLGIDADDDMAFAGWHFRLAKRLEKKNALKELKDYEQEIAAHKAAKRSRPHK